MNTEYVNKFELNHTLDELDQEKVYSENEVPNTLEMTPKEREYFEHIGE